jgi:hypothetical protein
MKDIVTTIGKGVIGIGSYTLAQAHSLLAELPEWLRDPTKDLGYIIAILTIISLGHDVLKKYFGVDLRFFRRIKRN